MSDDIRMTDHVTTTATTSKAEQNTERVTAAHDGHPLEENDQTASLPRNISYHEEKEDFNSTYKCKDEDYPTTSLLGSISDDEEEEDFKSTYKCKDEDYQTASLLKSISDDEEEEDFNSTYKCKDEDYTTASLPRVTSDDEDEDDCNSICDESPSDSLSPPPDGGSINEWVFLPPDFQNIVHSSEDTTWTCAVCTFANHEALEVCEMCEMPRNRALEARA